MEEKEIIINEIKELITSAKGDVVEINPNYLDYFSFEELQEIKDNLLVKKTNYQEHSKEFVDELYEKTKKVGI